MSLKIGPNIVVSPARRADIENLYLTSYTYSQLNSTPGNEVGDMSYCSDAYGGDGVIVIWNGNDWFRSTATGGNQYQIGEYIYHVYTSPGNFNVQNTNTTIENFIISGGGGGASGSGGNGGGGAGGYILTSAQTLNPGTYPVVVGSGGASDTKGQSSSFNSISAEGGGAGNGGPGACGGGAKGPNSTRGTGSIGFPGGGKAPGGSQSSGSSSAGGGGGGMGSQGITGGDPSNGRAGGQGITIEPGWSVPTTYMPSTEVCGGGGGGGSRNGPQSPYNGGPGGSGGGGAGSRNRHPQTSTANSAQSRGSGGGGAGDGTGGSGSDGIVVIRYQRSPKEITT